MNTCRHNFVIIIIVILIHVHVVNLPRQQLGIPKIFTVLSHIMSAYNNNISIYPMEWKGVIGSIIYYFACIVYNTVVCAWSVNTVYTAPMYTSIKIIS